MQKEEVTEAELLNYIKENDKIVDQHIIICHFQKNK